MINQQDLVNVGTISKRILYAAFDFIGGEIPLKSAGSEDEIPTTESVSANLTPYEVDSIAMEETTHQLWCSCSRVRSVSAEANRSNPSRSPKERSPNNASVSV